MSELLLDSLRIKGYRFFENLSVEKLGRVNLVVGRNNVGKMAFLEALWLYANDGSQPLMFEILRERNEIPPLRDGNLLVQPESSRGLRNLFYDRPELKYVVPGSTEYIYDRFDIQIGQNISIETADPDLLTKTVWLTGLRPERNGGDEVPSIRVKTSRKEEIKNSFIKAAGLTDARLIEFWDNIERLVLDDLVLKALQTIAPDVLDIRFSGYPSGAFTRVPVVRLKDAKERVPLRSLGDGMTRILGIASALVNCRRGILLIDEIESGLYHSVLPDVWKLIFKTARDLDVQVFATTHSKDCVEAFAEAAEESPDEGMLIRLERRGDKIFAKTIEEERLVNAVNYEVEVR